MSLKISKVGSRKQLKQFIHFYTHLYKGNQQVAFPLHMDEINTLREDKNPAHLFCKCSYWLAYRNNKIVGRIAAIINQQEQAKLQEQIGRFGWFDFEDDVEVSEALMNTAISWLKKQNVSKVHGPMGFTDMDRQGLLIEGFDKLSTMATLYNFPYYETHINYLGFKKSADWIEFELQYDEGAAKKLQLLAQRAMQRNQLKSLKLTSRKRLRQKAPEIFQLINECYKGLYGYIPLSEKQVAYYTNTYLSFVNLDLISLVVDESEKLVGFGLSMPSFTSALQKMKGKLLPLAFRHILKALRKNNRLDLYLIAVDQNYQNKGVNAIIMSDILTGAGKMGIKSAETNIELEENLKVQSMWRFLPNTQHKRRRCYSKTIHHE